MPPASHAVHDLDARLNEIDDTLRLIQAELSPDRDPRPTRPAAVATPVATTTPEVPAAVATPTQDAPVAVVAKRPAQAPPVAADPHSKLLAAMHELLDAYTIVVGQLDRAPGPPTA